MPMIRTIHSDLRALIEAQDSVINALASEIQKIRASKGVALQELQTQVKALLPAGNDERYAQLTRAIQDAGGNFNFTKMVTDWTQQDEVNRSERAEIESRWGTRHEITKTYAVRKEQLQVTKSALSQTSAGVDAFDETTRKIKEHNEKYPGAEITEENHDGYESTTILRWLGYYSFINRGPHHAYLTIGDYTKEHGDYYEIARDVAKMREDRKSLEIKNAAENKAYNEVSAVVRRMDQLDNAYRGPEGIAREIRKVVGDFLLKDDDFGLILHDKIATTEARAAALALAKIRTFDVLESNISRYHKNASNTKEDMERPLNLLSQSVRAVGNESIYFDFSYIEAKTNGAAKSSRHAIREFQKEREEIEEYNIPATASLYFPEVEKHLRLLAHPNIDMPGNRVDLDFRELERKVRHAVDSYEAEQARLRAEAAAAAEAERQRLREETERAERARQRAENSATISSTFEEKSSGSTAQSDSATPRSPGGISGGSRGITPRHNDPS